MDDRPVINFHDFLVAEIVLGGFWNLVEGGEDRHDGFPQLVLDDNLLWAVPKEIIRGVSTVIPTNGYVACHQIP